MLRFSYKGCRVEIFTRKKGLRWTWAFVINGTEAKTNTQGCCDTIAAAASAAKSEACRFIDKEVV
jgi:hypothetical protein